MKIATGFLLTLVAFVVYAAPLSAQQKIAEGEYQLLSLEAHSQIRHWVLTDRATGGYLLHSEIENPAEGVRVVQVEELNDQLIPSSIGYELYLKKHTKPDVSMKCNVMNDAITCSGESEKGVAKPSQPYLCKGPFLFLVQDLSRFDLAWLMAGTLNRSHLTSGNTLLRTITVSGGAALELTDEINIAAVKAAMSPNQKFTGIRPEHYTEWEFSTQEDEETLTLVATEDVELAGTKVSARHYSLTSSDATMHFWLAQPGVLIKMSIGEDGEYLLSNYRQYRKFVPEMKVNDAPQQ